ncbi:TetR/AcrR family transcriptional regulator [Streptomyces sp. NPDC048384]|uniref:TetR/AcrR family transcriptional regulator n=1 Tax=Streptomyces sp. NPDC048384 TaxID=3155487 RepID=UPI00344812F3
MAMKDYSDEFKADAVALDESTPGAACKFPTREALIEAAYRNELARVCDSAAQRLADHAPDEALRLWMDDFIDYLAAKQGMADALRAAVASGADPFAETLDKLATAIGTLLRAGADAALLRRDMDPFDVGFSLAGIGLITSAPTSANGPAASSTWLLDSLRYGANGPASRW